MTRKLATCSVCPRLCRHACPVATGTGREATVPTAIAGVLIDHARGLVDDATALAAATLCTDCGACQDACHLHQPLPDALAEVRRSLLPAPTVPPLPEMPTGQGPVGLEAVPGELDGWRKGRPADLTVVACSHRLGVAERSVRGLERRAASIRVLFRDRAVYTQDGGIAQVLSAAGVPFQWCDEDARAVGSCACTSGQRPGLACCGGAGPLAQHHPEDAARLAAAFARRLPDAARLLDQRCVHHLRDSGVTVNGVWGCPQGDLP